ncbi:serine hydrolase [Lewinellaceae bacterium SD302]|nr:serine hydrolase [Lewinellaceae bacterium SD302]
MSLYRSLYLLKAVTLVFSLNAQELYFPPSHDAAAEWAVTTPEELSWQTDSIASLYEFLEAEQTDAFLVLKDGKIVLEQYFGTYTQDSIHYWASASKSLRAMLVGIAQEEGELDINDPTSDYLGEGWTSLDQEQEDSITVLSQLKMTSGLNEFLFGCTDPACLLYRAPVDTRWAYHNAPYALLRDVLETATGQTQNAFTNSRFEDRVGGSNGIWVPYDQYNTTYFSRARLMARYGLLIQNDGNWDGVPVIQDADYLNAMLSPSQDLNPSYGYLWWLNGQDSYISPDNANVIFPGPLAPDAPADVVLAAGRDGQFISISREEGLIMIRQGDSSSESLAPIDLHNEIWRRLNFIREVVSSTTENNGSATPSDLASGRAGLLAMKTYPNPARETIYFDSPVQGDFWISLYDQQGRLLMRERNKNQIARNGLAAGLYRLSVSNGSQRASSWVQFE